MNMLIPALLSVVSAILYCAVDRPRVLELMRLVFQAAILVLIFVFAQSSLRVLVDR